MTVTEIFAILAAGQLLLFGCYTMLSADIVHKSLSRFLLANSLFIINFLLTTFYITQNPAIRPFIFWGETAGYLFGPFLYFYTLTVTGKHNGNVRRELPHYIPALLFVVVYVLPYHFIGTVTQPWRPEIAGIKLHPLLNAVMIIQIVAYLLLALKHLRAHSEEAKNSLSSYDAVQISWLKLTLAAFTAMWAVDAFTSGFNLLSFYSNIQPMVVENVNSISGIISLGINLVFANVIIIKGLKQTAVPAMPVEAPDTLPVQAEAPEEAGEGKDSTPKKQWNQGLKPHEKKEVLEKLNKYMAENKPYLRPTLTIAHIASDLKMPSRFISQVINEDLGKNFFDFINTYRIEEVILQFKDSRNSGLTITALMYDAGFNSKSVFNAAFKKYTGITPSEYRRGLETGAVA